MTWLKRADRRWGIEDEGKIGDLKLASQIREICNSVADSAEAVSVLYYGPMRKKQLSICGQGRDRLFINPENRVKETLGFISEDEA